ncbi:MAG: hypothetical protein J5906_04030, partial [Acidaminococcaceae bacterium]|nr:hypothetical protein [Acidaminococcaceae bacterium]
RSPSVRRDGANPSGITSDAQRGMATSGECDAYSGGVSPGHKNSSLYESLSLKKQIEIHSFLLIFKVSRELFFYNENPVRKSGIFFVSGDADFFFAKK